MPKRRDTRHKILWRVDMCRKRLRTTVDALREIVEMGHGEPPEVLPVTSTLIGALAVMDQAYCRLRYLYSQSPGPYGDPSNNDVQPEGIP